MKNTLNWSERRAIKSIEIEDIATVFASQFVRETSFLKRSGYCSNTRMFHRDFLKMNYARRKKIVEKVLDKMLGELHEKRT